MHINACINKNYFNAKFSPSFNGSMKKTEQGTPYYSTTSATNVGYVTAAAALGARIISLFRKVPTTEEAEKYVEKLKNELKDSHMFTTNNLPTAEEYIKTVKAAKKYALPFGLIAAAASIGCGVLVDKLRNQKAAETADKIKKLGLQNAMSYDNNIDMSRNGRGYYYSNIGSKYGPILGAACGCISSCMTYVTNKKDMSPLATILAIGIFALGGWFVGEMADRGTNDDARLYS